MSAWVVAPECRTFLRPVGAVHWATVHVIPAYNYINMLLPKHSKCPSIVENN